MTTAVQLEPPSALERVTSMRLRDGRRVSLRMLTAADADGLAALFESADPADLRRRFLGQPPPLTSVVRRLTTGDGVHHLALGAFDDAGNVVGVAQFDRRDEQPTAEFAIEVARDWQHDHLGSVMLRRVAALARDAGITRFNAVFFADNLAIQRLLRHSGGAGPTAYEEGEGRLTVDLAAL